ATGCRDRKTRILDVQSGIEHPEPPEGKGQVRALTFRPDSLDLVVATGNEDGSVVILLDATTGTEIGRVKRLLGCAHLAFSADGAMLAAAWDDDLISIYEITG